MLFPRSVLVLLVVFAVSTGGCGDEPELGNSLGDRVRADSSLSTLKEGLDTHGLLLSLDEPGPFTLFAPTDEAFTALSLSADVLTSSERYRDFFARHIHEGSLSTSTLETRTAIAGLAGPDIHVRQTLDGIVLDDGVKLSVEPVQADNGLLYIVDTVLARPLVTTHYHHQQQEPALLGEDGFIFHSSILEVEDPGYIHNLRVHVDLEANDVESLEFLLRTPTSLVSLTPSIAVDGTVSATFTDSALTDITEAMETGLGQGSYHPLSRLELLLGQEAKGEWELYVFGEMKELEDPEAELRPGVLTNWGVELDLGDASPAPALVINRRRIPGLHAVPLKTMGLGFTEELGTQVERVGGLTGNIQLTSSVGELSAEATIGEEGRFGSMLYRVPAETAAGSADAVLIAQAGDVSRVLHFPAEFVRPDSSSMEMLSQLSLLEMGGQGYEGNDIWGWTDPQTGTEIVLMGMMNGTAFVDVTTPSEPVILGMLKTETRASLWRDMKVYQDHAYIVSEADEHGLQVFDLTQLRGVTAPQSFAPTAVDIGFGNAHNIVINEDTGFAYMVGTELCNGGFLIYDLAVPTSPTSVGCFSGGVPTGGNPELYPVDVYTHDAQCVVYTGPDVEHQGKEICVSSDEDTIGIADLSDKGSPVQVARVTYSGAGYTHQGWLTEDHRYFLLNDEFDEVDLEVNTRSYVWDLVDLDAPVLVGEISNPRDAVGHNTYISGGEAFQANYSSGLRIIDLNQIAVATGVETAYYDTFPDDDKFHDTSFDLGPDGLGSFDKSYNGAWSNYPFFASGTIVVSDTRRCLFVLRRVE